VGDVFVLLSDGVHNVVPNKRLKALITENAQSLSELLVTTALEQGSGDNCTALVVRVLGILDATLQDENRLAQQLEVPPRLKVGDTIDGVAVTSLIADNGINILYQVRDIESRRLYALKTLNPQRAHDAQERAMLAHEAWLAKRMASSRAAENLVAVHEPLVDSPTAFYLLYEWHPGETLQQMLDRKHRFTLGQTVAAATHVARALGRLHRQGVIHRDVKPANLHQGEDGVLRLLDLGVALSGREPESTRLLHAGTPSYMNPEQWGFQANGAPAAEEAPNAQSDLFALGVTLYQLLTGGKLPYGDVLPYQAGRYWRDPIAPSRHNPEVPIWLDHVVLKAVARDKRLRFETAEEFLLALERGASRPLTAPPPTPLIQRDPTARWKIALGISLLFNALLVYWLLFLPK
jgi:serine/threonine protein kinase